MEDVLIVILLILVDAVHVGKEAGAVAAVSNLAGGDLDALLAVECYAAELEMAVLDAGNILELGLEDLGAAGLVNDAVVVLD